MSYKLLAKLVKVEIQSILDGKEQEFSYLVEGPHGIGKSAFWKEVCIDYNGYFVDLRLGQRDLGDIIGLPTIVIDSDGTKHMVHIKPELVRKMFVRSLDELGLMGDESDRLSKLRSPEKIGLKYDFILGFLDEYNRGTKDVQQAVFELVYDRTMNGDRIHPKCLLAAACNDNLEIYTITEGDPAFRSRFKTVKFVPTVEEWLSWGKRTGQLCEELIFVIEGKKDLADPPKLKEGGGEALEYLNQPHPNRRSWHEFSKFYVAFRDQFTEIEMRDICTTFVGHQSAEIFRLVSSQMVQKKKSASTAQTAEMEKIDQLFDMYIRVHRMSDEQAVKILDTFTPSDMQAFTDHCIKHLSKYQYITAVTKNRVESLAKILPEEIFARIWREVDNKYKLKDKMIEHVTAKNIPDFFDKFDSGAST